MAQEGIDYGPANASISSRDKRYLIFDVASYFQLCCLPGLRKAALLPGYLVNSICRFIIFALTRATPLLRENFFYLYDHQNGGESVWRS
jgi:hypothetical protein